MQASDEAITENRRTETPHIPMWLLAELTYACPLQCPYCSNPVELSASRKQELTTEEWLDLMQQARKLGAVQLGFSGGEPAVRRDLEELVRRGTAMGFFCNLITSGMGLTAERISALSEGGLNHIQISFEGADRKTNGFFGGTDSYDQKLAMVEQVNRHGIPLGLNFVLHRQNMHQVTEFLELAETLGAEFVELANTQYYGWAFHNRDKLMPSRHQVEEAEAATNRFREQSDGRMNVFFVRPDYFDGRPKKCSNGWGTTFISVSPEGEILPCQSAKVIPGVEIPMIREQSLSDIWHHSRLFNRFRGTDWMQEPCASCPEREIDLGGCRCQAYLLTGDPAATDPVCDLSPEHHRVNEAVAAAQHEADPDQPQPLVFRNTSNARRIRQQTE